MDKVTTMPTVKAVIAENLVKTYDKGAVKALNGLSLDVEEGTILGVLGPNGAGKTTLFKTILGLEKADSGSVKIGETVKISYVDQSRGGIDPKKITLGCGI